MELDLLLFLNLGDQWQFMSQGQKVIFWIAAAEGSSEIGVAGIGTFFLTTGKDIDKLTLKLGRAHKNF